MQRAWRRFLREDVTRHHGVAWVQGAVARGIAERSFYARAENEGWLRLQRGAYLISGAPRTFEAEVAAALLCVGGRVAATGATALHLHGVLDEPPAGIQIAVPSDRARPAVSGADDIVRTSTLQPADVVIVGGSPVLTPAWALLHAGRNLSPRRVLELTIDAEQRRVLSRPDLDEVLVRCGRQKGRGSLRAARETLGDVVVDSLLELDARTLLVDAGFEVYPAPFPFRCPDRRVIHLDLALPRYWFAYECDSPQSRAGGRAFHLDRKRWSQAQQGGWRIGWITRDRLVTDRAGILAEVAEVVASAPPRPPPPATPCGSGRCRVCAAVHAEG